MVEDLVSDAEGGGGAAGGVFGSGAPPGRGGGRWRSGGGERVDEIDDYGALGRGEVAVPEEIDGDVSFEDSPVVVVQQNWSLLHQS